jgi:hypothetical protein
MANRIFKISAAAAMLVATPMLASAEIVSYSTTSPVAITSFNLNESYVTGEVGGDVEAPPQFVASGVSLEFVNKSSRPATGVIFLLDRGKYSQRIVDKGIFSPGTPIKHTFGMDGGLDVTPNVAINVAEVDFADGSSWHSAAGVAATAHPPTPGAPAATAIAQATPESNAAPNAKIKRQTEEQSDPANFLNEQMKSEVR